MEHWAKKNDLWTFYSRDILSNQPMFPIYNLNKFMTTNNENDIADITT